MKLVSRLVLPLALVSALAGAGTAAEPLAGPKGGRILTEAAPHAEFFVDADRHVVITFYDANLQPVPAASQVITAVAEAPDGKVRLEFAPRDGGLISTAPLPAGNGYRVVVQVRADAAAKPVNYRVDYHAETCPECDRAEYACTCDHAGGEEHHH